MQRQAVAPSRKEATPKIRAAGRNRQGYFGVQSHPTATGRRTRLERKRQAVAVAGPVHVTIIDSLISEYNVTVRVHLLLV